MRTVTSAGEVEYHTLCPSASRAARAGPRASAGRATSADQPESSSSGAKSVKASRTHSSEQRLSTRKSCVNCRDLSRMRASRSSSTVAAPESWRATTKCTFT